MFFTKTDIDRRGLAHDHRDDGINQNADEHEQVQRGVVPRELAFQLLLGGRVAFHTAIGQERLFGHHQNCVVSPNRVQVVRGGWEVRLWLWNHGNSFWNLGRGLVYVEAARKGTGSTRETVLPESRKEGQEKFEACR